MTRFAWAVAFVGLLAATATAGPDLARIDRVIRKEPGYQTKAPRYCLLAFGPEARTRVWLVLDGDGQSEHQALAPFARSRGCTSATPASMTASASQTVALGRSPSRTIAQIIPAAVTR